MKKVLGILTAAAILLGVVYTVGAQPEKPYPIGQVTMEAKQLAAGVGFTWGDGTLKFEGKSYKFAVKGLNVAAVGFSKINAKGDVYNLKSASDLAGDYAAIQAGMAVVKGTVGLLMRNDKGVVINLKASQKGAQISLGATGLSISMK